MGTEPGSGQFTRPAVLLGSPLALVTFSQCGLLSTHHPSSLSSRPSSSDTVLSLPPPLPRPSDKPPTMSVHATTAPSVSHTLPRTKKRRAIVEHARKGIKIIGTIPAPLAPELPPSPPASRSPSPAPAPIPTASSSKRKLAAYSDAPESAKRPRVAKPQPSASEAAAATAPALPSGSPPLAGASSSKANAVFESANASSVTVSTSIGSVTSRSLTVYEPVRRPRRGKDTLDFKLMHKTFYTQARAFKYSGEARYLSTYPQQSTSHRPLREPPAKGTPYHTHGGLMALLESLDGLICFVYAAWSQDHICTAFNDAWKTIPSYLHWCKSRWASYTENRNSVREKAFVGLIHMIEAFVYQRIVRFKLTPHLESHTREYLREIELVKAKQVAVDASKTPTSARLTPPEKSLPSPDTDAASANSTPANPSNSTPLHAGNNRSEDAKRAGNRPQPHRPPEGKAPPEPTVSVKQSYITSAKSLVVSQAAASQEMHDSEKTLSLAIIREHFPHTFGRMVCSTLSAEEEYEPDMEDGEGELFWPSQCVTGEGIAWVCLMGRAMVREFGKDIGYVGFAGIVPKPGGSASS